MLNDEVVRGIVLNSRDVTEREHLRTALDTTGDQLREAQSVAKVGIWEWDIANDEVRWSDELYRIFGLTPRDGDIGRPFSEVLRDRPDVIRVLVSAFELSHLPNRAELREVVGSWKDEDELTAKAQALREEKISTRFMLLSLLDDPQTLVREAICVNGGDINMLRQALVETPDEEEE